MFTLHGKKILITGGSRGIGRAIAREFAKAGGTVCINYARNDSEAEKTLASLAGENHCMFKADLSKPCDVQSLITETNDRLGGIDVLVNNAAIAPVNPLHSNDFDEWNRYWQQVFNTNLMSVVNASYLAIPIMKKNGGGTIINISSRSAFRAEKEIYIEYAATKAAIINFTKCLAASCACDNITANAIAPGWVDTEMADRDLSIRSEEILAEIPLGRLAIAKDVASAALFLASDEARYLTGATIDVNGGSYFR